MNSKTIFTGSAVALVTPFKDDFSVDFEAIDRLCDFQLEGGTDAIVVCGTTGEASTLSREEHLAVVERVVKRVNGRIPVIAGTGSNDTAFAIETSRAAEKIGVDALLLVTPYYNKASQQGLIKHFTAIANSVSIPVILYNVPGRTGVNMLPETCLELSKVDNIVAVKEASDNLSQITKLAAICEGKLDIYSGSDNLIVPVMSVGGKGVISVLANVMPRETHDMCAAYLEGDVERSRRLQLDLLDLCNDLFCDVNPIPAKTALNHMGFACGPCRLPLCEMSLEADARLYATLKKHNLV